MTLVATELDRPMQVTTMRAAVVTAPGEIEVRNVPLPEPGPGQVRIRLEGCGVCHSNLPPFEGRPWFNYPMEPGGLGHEGWGVIDELGPGVEGFEIGDRVSAISYHAYAEYDVADAGSVVCLPAMLEGMPFPAEPLGCAINIFRRSKVSEGQTVAIIGIGFLGALLTRLSVAAGARVIAISRRPYSLEVAKLMGADEVVPMDDHQHIIERVKQLTGEQFCDVVIEAVGQQWPIDLAGELTKIRGRLVIAGYHQDGLRQVNMQLWNWRGIDVINAHERDPKAYLSGMQMAVEDVAMGRLDPRPLFTHTFPLEQLGVALEMTRDRPDGFLKALIQM